MSTQHTAIVELADCYGQLGATITIYADSYLVERGGLAIDSREAEYESQFTPSPQAADDAVLLLEEAATHMKWGTTWVLSGEPAPRKYADDALVVRAERDLWTVEQAADHLGIKPDSARGLFSRRGLRRYDMVDHPVSGRPQARYRASAVRALAEDRQPGRRTDRT